jgi:hypothetical protein
MTLSLRLSIALFALALLAAGSALAFAPLKIAHDFAVAATGVAGLGTLRADLGGCFIALGLFTLAGVRPGHARWLTVPLAFIAAFLLLRLLHLGLDGVSEGGLRSTVVECSALTLLVFGRRVLAAQDRA